MSLVPSSSTLARLSFHSLGSPLHHPASSATAHPQHLLRFVHALRGLMRSCNAVSVLSVPTHLYSQSVVQQLRNLCDVSVYIRCVCMVFASILKIGCLSGFDSTEIVPFGCE